MSFYCPECGEEVSDGVKCSNCGHVDEKCSNCNTPLDDNAWFCGDCNTPRNNCIECGQLTHGDTCSNCGTERPDQCDSCGGLMESGTIQCNSCGHKIGGKYRSRARKVKYAGYIIAGLLLLPALPQLFFVTRMPISSVIRLIPVILLPPAIVLLLTKLLTRRWVKKANKKAN